MKLAFYYHITIYEEKNCLFVPGFLAVFLDSLASNVDHLALVMHQAKDSEKRNCDYTLISKNITWINLGLKTPAWHLEIFYKKILKNKLQLISHYDAFIVRSPTPLAAYFHKFIKVDTKLWFMIVGDYVEGADHLIKSSFREKLIYLYLYYNDFLFQKQIRKTDVLVNSPALYRKYINKAKSIHQIRTTTISTSDFYSREDTCIGPKIELLYTGRLDPSKGLFELVAATAMLIEINYPICLNIVGWEDDKNSPVERKLKQKAAELTILDKVKFHGRKAIGHDLNEMYRMADIYIIPSYHEGFPRTIWEAMANGLPVIATSVGGIPEYLQNNLNAILIHPKNVVEIVNSVEILIKNGDKRKKLIQMGYQLALNVTLEKQSSKLVNILNSHESMD